MDQPITLALDVGTSSVRAALYDGNANLISNASVKIERSLIATFDGGSEIDADEAFQQIIAAIDAVLEKTEKLKGEIKYVASCGFWHSLVGIDAKSRPTTKVFGWADTRSREYTTVLRKKFDESKTHNRTGARFHSSFWPAKLLWLRKEFPDIFAKTDKWFSFGDYVGLKLSGDLVTSISMASGTGILDIRKCIWDAKLLRFLEITPSHLPKISGKDSDIFSPSKTFAKRWPRLSNAKWFPMIADGAADNIGAGCVTRSRTALMVGTSAAMRVAYEGDPPNKIPDGLWCYRVDRRRVIIGGALSDGGSLYDLLTRTLKIPDNAGDEIRRRGAAAHGLALLPFFFGERSTGYHENVRGAILGLTSAHDSIDILQAAMESVAYRFAEIFDELNSVVKIKEIVASGGALRDSPVWTQIIADVLGRDLSINDASESSSRGAVLLALESIGKIENIENSAATTVSEKPAYHPKCHGAYKLARKQHRLFYKTILNKNL